MCGNGCLPLEELGTKGLIPVLTVGSALFWSLSLLWSCQERNWAGPVLGKAKTTSGSWAGWDEGGPAPLWLCIVLGDA